MSPELLNQLDLPRVIRVVRQYPGNRHEKSGNQAGLMGLEGIHPFREIGWLSADHFSIQVHVDHRPFGSRNDRGSKAEDPGRWMSLDLLGAAQGQDRLLGSHLGRWRSEHRANGEI